MSIRIDVDRSSFDRVKLQVRAMRDRAGDVTPAWQAVLDHLADRNFRQFTSRGSEYGTPWAPLAASTMAEKQRLGLPRDPLIRTGRLAHSVTLRPLDIERVRPQDMEAGTAVGYAHFHQDGTKHMPARPIMSPRAIRDSGVVTFALANWIIDGTRSVAPRRGGRR